jgi:CubicO group peptidase (beta-lactamase class C family)
VLPHVPRRAFAITVRDLLTMRSGWPGDGDPRNTIGNASNVVRALLDRPIVRPPGTRFAYDTSSSHLLSAVLAHATGHSEDAFAERRFFKPLGIELAEIWPKDDQGVTYGGTGLSLSARDATKLGQLYLDLGRWRGRSVVPATWVAASTRPQVSLARDRGYGYDWWTFRRGRTFGYAAIGAGGQFVAVVPRDRLVVTVFSDPVGVPPRLTSILFDDLLPTIDR